MEFFMQFIDLINNLGGYVTIQADGIFLERFLNICTRRNLDIWDIRHCGAQRLTANMSLASFREIRPVCRRTRTRLQIIRRRGFPFFAHRYRKRKFALLGLALAIFILWYTSGHIMGITVFGNSRISTDTILTHLARSGVSLGETTEGIDSALIRNRMMGDLDDLAWIGINVSGSRIYVEVVERLETEPGVNMEQPCNLVAAKDGIIESVEARNGQTMVKPKAGVREGDVLVSGIMDNDARGYRYVHAYGDVYAQTRYSLTREYPLEYDEALDTGETRTRYTLRVLDRSLPLFFSQDPPYPLCAREETEREYRLPFGFLPSLYIKSETYREQYTQHKKRTASQALEQATEELDRELREGLSGDIAVAGREVSNTLTERGTLSVTVTLVCRENIAREAAIDPPDSGAGAAESES